MRFIGNLSWFLWIGVSALGLLTNTLGFDLYALALYSLDHLTAFGANRIYVIDDAILIPRYIFGLVPIWIAAQIGIPAGWAIAIAYGTLISVFVKKYSITSPLESFGISLLIAMAIVYAGMSNFSMLSILFGALLCRKDARQSQIFFIIGALISPIGLFTYGVICWFSKNLYAAIFRYLLLVSLIQMWAFFVVNLAEVSYTKIYIFKAVGIGLDVWMIELFERLVAYILYVGIFLAFVSFVFLKYFSNLNNYLSKFKLKPIYAVFCIFLGPLLILSIKDSPALSGYFAGYVDEKHDMHPISSMQKVILCEVWLYRGCLESMPSVEWFDVKEYRF